MTLRTNRNKNTNDTAVITTVALNTSTAVTLVASNAAIIFLDVNNNNSSHGFWVRLYPAATDNIKQGIFITNKNADRPFWEMSPDNMYTGEISAIADTDTPTAYITEY